MLKKRNVVAGLLLAVALLVISVGCANAEEAIQLKTSKEIPASIFGTQTHGDRRGTLPLIEKAGLKWVRNCIGWPQVEEVKGVLEIPKGHEGWVNDVVSRGINVNMILAYQNKHYPFDDFEKFKKGYANYCAFMAKTLKGKVKVWEIWNEPSVFYIRKAYGGSWNAKEGTETPWLQKYTDLTIAAAKAIRNVDPDATIIAGSCIFPVNYHFMDLLKEKGGIELLDGLVIHPYTFKLPPEVSPYGGDVIAERDGMSVSDDNTYSSIIRLMKEKMKAVGMRTTDIYATEFGFSTYHPTIGSAASGPGGNLYEGFSEQVQAKYLARYFILHLVNGIKVAIQYDFQNDGTGVKNAEHNFGLVKHPSQNYEPKPSYYAVQRICSLLSEPVKQFKPDWQTTVSPDRYLTSKNWKYIEPSVIWDGQEVQSLNRVEKYLFKNSETGEVMLVLWNAVRSSDRQPLLSDVTLDTADYTGFAGIDMMTGKSFKVNSSVKDGKTVLTNVTIPDYPVVIKMSPKQI
ncbi:MAG: hypothetical protein DRP56_06310 [Planctomycetota bacterium]|nr:MAG: hypothetical protein DRP56_06310 [Planctomycetota bacterium]